ncbi:MAG: hypothetical protein IPJ34_16660 [Myxococcales bacterium]|nr:hypothetical protein [Myxococcales bacterium]MBL8721983.1 hypothetical protein [Myxococcales bacterium]
MANLPHPDRRALERSTLRGYAREELDEVESGMHPLSFGELGARLAQLRAELAREAAFGV